MYDPSVEKNFSVEEILNDKIVDGKLLYFVKWKGFPSSQNSWEPEDHLKNAPDHIQFWKEKKKKLQRIDKICKRKKIDEESFDGKKYLKKNIDLNILSNQKRKLPKRKSKQIPSKHKQDTDELSTSKDLDSQSCNSETTSYRGKGLEKKKLKSKDPIESILQSIKKLKQKSEQESKLDVPKNDLPIEIKQAEETKNSSPKIKPKSKPNVKNQLTMKKQHKKMNARGKLTQQKVSKKIDQNPPKNQLKSKASKNSLKKELDKKNQPQKSTIEKYIEKQVQNPQQQSEMFSISKKELMARFQQGNSQVQSNIPIQSQVPQQTSQNPLPTGQQIPRTVTQQAPQQVSQQIQQQAPQNESRQVSSKVPLQNVQTRVSQPVFQTMPVPYQNPLPQYYPQVSPYQMRQHFHMPAYLPQRPVDASFSNMNPSSQFANSQFLVNAQKPKAGNLYEAMNAYTMGQMNQKNVTKQISREFFLNKSFEQKQKSIDNIQIKDPPKPLEQPPQNFLQKIIQVPAKTKEQSCEIRPQIYDDVEKQQRQRSREREQQRQRKQKRDKKKKKSSKHDKHDKHRKSKKRDRKHKKNRRHSSSSSSERHKKSKKHRKDSSSSSSFSSRSNSPQFSSSEDESSSLQVRSSRQNLSQSRINDKVDRLMMPKEKRLPYYLDALRQGKHDKKDKKESKKKSNRSSNSFESKQRDGKINKPNHLIEIRESSSNNSSSLAVIDEEEFAGGIRKRVALNEDYNQKWKTSDNKLGHDKQKKNQEKHIDTNPSIDPLEAAQNLIDFFQSHPSKWWKKDMNVYIKEIRKSVKKDIQQQEFGKNNKCQQQSMKSSFDNSNDWEFPFQSSREKMKIEHHPFSQKAMKMNSLAKSLVSDSKMGHESFSTSKSTTVQQSQSKTADTQSFNLLVGDILQWFKDLYPEDEITQQIRKEIESLVQQIADDEIGDDFVEKWMENYGKKRLQKRNQENSSETKDFNQKDLQKRDKKDSDVIFQQNDKKPDYIATYFRSKEKKSPENIVKLEYDAVCDNTTIQQTIPNENANRMVKRQEIPIPENSSREGQKKEKDPKQDAKESFRSSTQNQVPPVNSNKPKAVVESNSIIKIVSEFKHKGLTCYKILLNNGREVNAHETDVKKNCPEILLKFYEEKSRLMDDKTRKEQDYYRNR